MGFDIDEYDAFQQQTEESVQDFRRKLDALSSLVLKAYLNSVVFIYIVQFANDKHRPNIFLFDYSYYTIKDRAIISTKCIIEPQKGNRITLAGVIKELQQYEKYKKFADEMYLEYEELFNSAGAKRVKDFRDSLCHNIENDSDRMLYCKDIMTIIDTTMHILENVYQYVFNTKNEDFSKIQQIAMALADDYWSAICEQADKAPKRTQELTELQRMLDGKK